MYGTSPRSPVTTLIRGPTHTREPDCYLAQLQFFCTVWAIAEIGTGREQSQCVVLVQCWRGTVPTKGKHTISHTRTSLLVDCEQKYQNTCREISYLNQDNKNRSHQPRHFHDVLEHRESEWVLLISSFRFIKNCYIKYRKVCCQPRDRWTGYRQFNGTFLWNGYLTCSICSNNIWVRTMMTRRLMDQIHQLRVTPISLWPLLAYKVKFRLY